MKKHFIWVSVSVTIALLVGGVAYYIQYVSDSKKKELTSAEKQTVQKTPSNESLKKKEQDKKDINILSIGGQEYNLLDEERVQRLIHEMTHTKVISDASNRYVEITPERVDVLISAIAKSNWDDNAFLLEHLKRWKNHDFSKSVELHNYIWEKEGGVIGKATGLKKD